MPGGIKGEKHPANDKWLRPEVFGASPAFVSGQKAMGGHFRRAARAYLSNGRPLGLIRG